MKLNLGCGFNKLDGYINVDLFETCQPDVVCNLEETPWVWETNSVSEILMSHVLEHLGADAKVFLAIMQELYRVCQPGAILQIHVPHPRHDHFLGDPTHVRPITPALFALFSKRLNREWQKIGANNTPLALYLNVDFEIINLVKVLDEPYMTQYQNNQISLDDLNLAIKEKNNIVSELQLTVKVIK